jgi:cytochrome subunit of sulfide dehydrogenase
MGAVGSLVTVSRLLMVVAGAALVATPAFAADAQLLASSCSGCHTTDDKLTTTIPKIRGLPESAFLEAMRAFRAGQRPATVMSRIAKGFTDDEIKQLAAYFSAGK